MATANQVPFPGFQFPTTTPVPDEVFEVLMPQLSGAELKVLLYICAEPLASRKTLTLSPSTKLLRALQSGTEGCLMAELASVSGMSRGR
jgi:hypothetical protein